jgi:DNA-binding YbaB/EbfC family protein
MNMDKLMKQAQRMQAEMALAQEQLVNTVVEGVSGGGMVKAKVNGNGDVLSVSISPEVVDPKEVEMLEDLIILAIKEALKQSREMSNNKMNSITGGMGGFPGLM